MSENLSCTCPGARSVMNEINEIPSAAAMTTISLSKEVDARENEKPHVEEVPKG
jgi:hypothetical protein